MIGVIARDREMDAVREFFELFKTPWEQWNSEKSYEVVLCTTGESPSLLRAQLVLAYSGTRLASDPANSLEEHETGRTKYLSYKDYEFPVYGNCITFPAGGAEHLVEKASGRPAALHIQRGERKEIVRVGYDLFDEIRFLLVCGQPIECAAIPTLEMHVDFLRDQLRASEIAFVEIPPVPKGYRLIACLTHDVDHPALRRHRWDHTAGGFLYRGSIGTLLKFLRGRSSARELMRNWTAVAKWSFIQLGLARDFWADFNQQYRKIEGGLPSTYFVIPFAGRSGHGVSGLARKRRAAGYGIRDIQPTIERMLKNGDEIGLHGIDAWLDSEAGLQEFEEVRSLTGKAEIGVRMHWLCFDGGSPGQLERAGASYDSTIGYREGVGYPSGTMQAYMPLGAKSLMELPLHVMDTALFYPGYLGLTEEEANKILEKMVDNAERFGGCITINWHDRSLAPERLWDGPYRELVRRLKERDAWFATAGDVVQWFRARRAASFLGDKMRNAPDPSKQLTSPAQRLPSLQVIKHASRESSAARNAADLALKQ